jgi:hypothetical protein
VTRHVVMFSGGIGSWATAKRVASQHGTQDMVLLFADTLIEDEDLYRFIDEAARNIGVPLTKIADGRTPWDVMRDERIIGNSRIDPCSKILKRKLLDKWRDENCTVEDTVVYIGIDWSEVHRLHTVRSRTQPWRYEAPLCEPPYLSKPQMLGMLASEGICPPRLYALGFAHNNCGGTCIKAGQAQWALLWRTFPERYKQVEQWEQDMREHVGEHSILKDRTGGTTKPLTLRAFRERLERQGAFDSTEWGGCGCAL